MKYKPGGGKKPEPYDPNTGQYTSKSKIQENELKSVFTKSFLDLKNKDYPIYGVHGEAYCILYVNDVVKGVEINISDNKISDYLLRPLEKDDKSHFFELHGYKRSDSKKVKYNKITDKGLFVEMPTKIYSYKEGKYITITTIWKYDKTTKTLQFITVNLKKRKD